MANYPILKNYIIFCMNRLIHDYALVPPFLDAGCGHGEISLSLAARGWHGAAIDMSEAAVAAARDKLSPFPRIRTERKSLLDEHGHFQTVFLMDVLEHFEQDQEALSHVCSLLPENGYLMVCVPSNPPEWRWDDHFYGHYRRYTLKSLTRKMHRSGFSVCCAWDVTYPVFYFMRKLYTLVITRPPDDPEEDHTKRTLESAQRNAWHMPFVSRMLSMENAVWRKICQWQFDHYKEKTGLGHEMILLARRR